MTTLGQIAHIQSGGTPAKSNPAFWGGAIPWATAKDLKTLRLSDTEDHITEAGLSNGSRLAPGGATLVLVRGMTLLKDVPTCLLERPMAFNQDLKAVVARGADPLFLHYVLRRAQSEMRQWVELAGHGTGRLPTDQLEKLEVRLPSPAEQTRIGSALAAFDEKISLNRRMNESIDDLVLTEFELVLGDSDGGQLLRLSDLMVLSRDIVDPRESPDEWFDHYSLPAFDERRVPRRQRGEEIKSVKLALPAGAILVSKLNPVIPRVWLPFPSTPRVRRIASTEFMVLTPRAPLSMASLYAFWRSTGARTSLTARVTGTSGSHQRVRPEDVLASSIRLPARSAIVRFNEIAGPLCERQLANRRESELLAALRDARMEQLLATPSAAPRSSPRAQHVIAKA